MEQSLIIKDLNVNQGYKMRCASYPLRWLSKRSTEETAPTTGNGAEENMEKWEPL